MINIQTKWLVIGAFVFLLVLGGAGFVGYNLWRAGHTAKTENKLSTNQASAATESGKDAVNTVGNRTTEETHIDHQVQDVSVRVHAIPEGSDPIGGDLHAAGIDGLCQFAGYRGEPQCVQHVDPGQLANAGAGGTTP